MEGGDIIMSNIEDRIVAMKFDNTQFQKGVSSTLSLLGKLKASLNFGAESKGIQNLQTTGNKFNLNGMMENTRAVSAGFIAMSTVAITAISQITSRVLNAGATFAKGFSFGPIMDGLHEYETNLKSIQTIQANTDQPLTKINASLAELNKYSDQTIYNFSEMAQNIGTFTAAGVGLKDATSSIKGIANMAALSGSSSAQASSAMYQLSQAIAAGKVGAEDWNSVVNAGMAGKKLQNALAQTAVAMGDLNSNMITGTKAGEALKISGESFKQSIMSIGGKSSWLNSEVLVNTLATLDGRFSKSAMMAERTADGLQVYTSATADAKIAANRLKLEQEQGVKYTDEQFKSLMKLSDASFKSATEVKTLGQVFDVAKETIGSGWSASFQSIFGNLDQAKNTFTELSGSINGFINANALARNKVLHDWKAMRGRGDLIDGIKNIFIALGSVIKPISQAFREIFPAKTGADLVDMTRRFKAFTETLKIGPETAENLKRTFAGVFALFGIGLEVIKAVAGMFGKLFGAVGSGNGGILSFTGGLGDMLVAIHEALKNGTFLTTFFEGLGNILSVPIKLIASFAGALGEIFSGFSADNAAGGMERLGSAAAPLVAIGERLRTIWDAVKSVFSNVGGALSGVGTAIAGAFDGLGEALANSITPATFDSVLSTINAGLLGGILLLLKNFFKGGLSVDLGGGLFEAAGETLGAVTGQLKAMQTQIKAQTLLKIAGALALLTASIFVLSTIDPKKLAAGLGSAIVGMSAMQASIIALSKAISLYGALKLPLITLGLVLLGGALLLFAFAVKTMASLDWDDLAKGLIGVAAMLGTVSVAAVVLSKNSAGLVRAGAGMIVMGLGLKVMASALKDYAEMDWSEMAKGLAGVAGMLLIVSEAARLMPKSIVITSVGLVVFAVALKLLASAVKDMAEMSWGEMAKGMAVLASSIGVIAIGLQLLPKSFVFTAASLLILAVALKQISDAVQDMAQMSWAEMGKGMAVMAASLAIIATAVRLMPKNMLVTAVSLVILGTALKSIGETVAKMASMSWDEFGKGMAVLGGALAILAVALNVMKGTLVGSAALLVASIALGVLTPVLLALGSMSWESIAKGLVVLAGSLTIMGVAGLLLGPLVPVFIGLAAAMLVFGAGIALVGAGVLAFATGLTALVAVGGLAIGFIGQLFSTIIALIPSAMTALAEGIVGFTQVIGANAPVFMQAFVAIITGILDAVIASIPKIKDALLALLTGGLDVLTQGIPKMVQAGVNILLGLLRGFTSNIGKLAAAAVDAVVAFINAVAKQAPKLADAGAKAIIKFVNGLSKAIDDNAAEMGEAGGRLGVAIAKGIITGLGNMADEVLQAAKDLAGRAIRSVADKLKIPGGPAKEFVDMGERSGDGLAVGLGNRTSNVVSAAKAVGDNVISAMRDSLTSLPGILESGMDIQPVIAPVIDLDKFRQDASQIAGLLTPPVISPEVSYDQAASIASDQKNIDDSPEGESSGRGVTQYLTQNNYSPTEISQVEHYRQTKNLMSLAKDALGA